MNLAVFYSLDTHKQEFESIIQGYSDFWMRFHSVKFYSMYEDFKSNVENFFYLFLVDPESASSARMLKRVRQLKSIGAHDQSMIFALNDMDKITKENQALVTDDFLKMLKPCIKKPSLIWFSSRCFTIYQKYRECPENEDLKKDLRFSFWNEEQHTYLGLRSMIELGRMEEVKELAKVDELINLLNGQFLSNPKRSVLRDPTKKYLFVNDLNEILLGYLSSLDNVVINFVQNTDEFEKDALTEDYLLFYISVRDLGNLNTTKFSALNCLLLVDGGEDFSKLELQEKINDVKEKNTRIEILPTNTYYLRYLQNIDNEKVLDQLISDTKIVIHDKYGFPIIKTKINGWRDILENECGINLLIQKITERGDSYASAL